MYPILLTVGDFQLHTYGALGAIGFLIVAFTGLRDAKRKGWSRDRMVDVIFYTALAGILGARLVFLAQNGHAYQDVWSLISLRSGGLVFYGAPLVGIPVSALLIRRYGLPLWEVYDTFSRALPLAHGVSRLGCFGAGCCYGAPSSWPWAVVYTHPVTSAPHQVPVHPTQLYEAAGLFALAFWLARSEHTKGFSGQITLAYLGAYAVLRMLVEVFRGDADRMFVPVVGLSTSQAISLVLLIAVAAMWRPLARRGLASA